MIGIGGIEFICAQTPYSMKGLMVGTVFGSVVIIAFIGYGITDRKRISHTAVEPKPVLSFAVLQPRMNDCSLLVIMATSS